jgi:hypothetical protein
MRNSERSTFRRCRQKWHWSYNERWEADRPKGALSFGSLIHEALAERYPPGRKRGPHPAKTFERLYNAQPQRFDQWDDEGNRIPALELGIEMLNGYIREYGEDDHIEIIAPEMNLEVDIYDKDGNYVATWVGRGDAMYRNLARSTPRRPFVGMLEHKTAKAIEEELSIISGYGEQGLSYWWGASIVLQHMGLIPEGAQVDHVLYNWLKKSMPDLRPKNEDGHALNKPTKDALLAACAEHHIEIPKKATAEVLATLLRAAGVDPLAYGEPSKVQPKPLFHRYEIDFGQSEKDSIARRIRLEAVEMSMVRAKRLPIYKNPTKDCKWDCQFKDVCEVHEMGGDWESILELEFTKWDPYEGHELVEEKQ